VIKRIGVVCVMTMSSFMKLTDVLLWR